MPLEQGPFLQVADTALQFDAVDYGFTDYANTELADVDTTLIDVDALLLEVGTFGVLSDVVLHLPDLIEVAVTVDAQSSTLPLSSIGGLADALLTGDSQLAAAIGFAPPAAWVDPAGAFIPPDPSLTLSAPSLPLDAYNPTSSTPVGETNPAGTATVSIVNQTRPGQASFWVGDYFIITITGPVNAEVTYNAFLQGAAYASGDAGNLGDGGFLQVTGQMLPEYVGAWREDWYAGEQFITTLNFLVLSAS